MISLTEVGYCLSIIFIIFILALRLSKSYFDQGKTGSGRLTLVISVLIIIWLLINLLFSASILTKEEYEYHIELGIVEVNTLSDDELDFNITFADQNRSVKGIDIYRNKVTLFNITEDREYKFEITCDNFTFIGSKNTTSGKISYFQKQLHIEGIGKMDLDYEILLKRSNTIKIQTVGLEGNIVFTFKLIKEKV